MKRHFVVALVLLLAVAALPQVSNAQATNPGCVNLTRNLRFGLSGADVTSLQKFLNWKLSLSNATDPQILPLTGYFGYQTKAAVIKFQDLQMQAELAAVGLTQGNGNVYAVTRNKIRQLSCEASTINVSQNIPATVAHGAEVEVEWTDSLDTSNYTLTLRSRSDNRGYVIARNISTTSREYTWEAGEVEGASAVPGGRYVIKVCHNILTDACADSNEFTLLGTSEAITITSAIPTRVEPGTNLVVKWLAASNFTSNVYVIRPTTTPVQWFLLHTVPAISDGSGSVRERSYTWEVGKAGATTLVGGDYRFKICRGGSTTSGSGCTESSTFTVGAPSVASSTNSTITIIDDVRSRLVRGGTYMVRWRDTATDNGRDNNAYNLILRKVGGGAEYWIKTGVARPGGATITKSLVWTIGKDAFNNNIPAGNYYIVVCHDYSAKCAETDSFELANQSASQIAAITQSTITVVGTVDSSVRRDRLVTISWKDSADPVVGMDNTKYNLLLRGVGGTPQYLLASEVQKVGGPGVTKSYSWTVGTTSSGEIIPSGSYYVTVCHNYNAKCAYTNTFQLIN